MELPKILLASLNVESGSRNFETDPTGYLVNYDNSRFSAFQEEEFTFHLINVNELTLLLIQVSGVQNFD